MRTDSATHIQLLLSLLHLEQVCMALPALADQHYFTGNQDLSPSKRTCPSESIPLDSTNRDLNGVGMILL